MSYTVYGGVLIIVGFIFLWHFRFWELVVVGDSLEHIIHSTLCTDVVLHCFGSSVHLTLCFVSLSMNSSGKLFLSLWVLQQ